jgi:hypothetical protein
MKIVASIVFALSAWLAWGAGSLHEKDPGHYGTGLMLLLGGIALVSLLVLFFGKSGAASKSKAKARG